MNKLTFKADESKRFLLDFLHLVSFLITDNENFQGAVTSHERLAKQNGLCVFTNRNLTLLPDFLLFLLRRRGYLLNLLPSFYLFLHSVVEEQGSDAGV